MSLTVRQVNDAEAGRVFLVKGLNLTRDLGAGIACEICSLRDHRNDVPWCSNFVSRANFTCNSARKGFEVPIAGDTAEEALQTVTALMVARRLQGE